MWLLHIEFSGLHDPRTHRTGIPFRIARSHLSGGRKKRTDFALFSAETLVETGEIEGIVVVSLRDTTALTTSSQEDKPGGF